MHAWAAWRVYKMTGPRGQRDRAFLESAFQKLLLNFTWWVNRKDAEGNNLFSGGFLGLDNIGVFDRSKPLPTGGFLQQADGTAWMAFYCLTMLLDGAGARAKRIPAYEDMASKFFEHFVHIADAMNTHRRHRPVGRRRRLLLRPIEDARRPRDSAAHPLVGRLAPADRGRGARELEDREAARFQEADGLVPRSIARICATHHLLRTVPGRRPPDARGADKGTAGTRAALHARRKRISLALRPALASRATIAIIPTSSDAGNEEHRVDYVPGEGTSYLFGGNSNWRGPIWFPINYLIVEALERYHHFYGDGFKVECPTGSGNMMNLKEVAQEISRRLTRIFLPDENGARPCHGEVEKYATDPHWRDLVLFNEYFHGETGRGLGASHQTGWTALAVKLLENAIDDPDRTETHDHRESGSRLPNAAGAKRGRRAESATVTV